MIKAFDYHLYKKRAHTWLTEWVKDTQVDREASPPIDSLRMNTYWHNLIVIDRIFLFILFCLLLAVGGLPTLPKKEAKASMSLSVVHLVMIFFAAWLLMPGIPAMIGIAPSPPDAPRIGYGADPGPFTVTIMQHYTVHTRQHFLNTPCCPPIVWAHPTLKNL